MTPSQSKTISPSCSKIVLSLLVSILLSSCAIHINGDQKIDGFRFTEGAEQSKGAENFTLLQSRYGQEWQLNRGDKNAPPALGLAMSGGGMRSAAFNIGILQGLHDAGQLSKVDIMSAVSGGSYAMSWYYLQKYNSQADDATLFDPGQRFQKHLEENGRIAIHSDNFFIEAPEYLTKVGANIVATPLHWLANGLFDWNLNLAPYRWFYQNAIEREFHLTPAPNNDGFVNDSSLLGVKVGVRDGVSFPAMRDFIEAHNLPSFIINTTVTISDSMDHYAADFGNSIFEFTPYAYGSDSFGYQHEDFPIDIHTAIAISGAAADSSIIPNKLAFMFSALNIDLGYNISNYNLTEPSKVIRHNLLPVPFYFGYRNSNDIRGSSIYLTDGGHSDNLGAYSLVRRLCKKIIIVDAEHDPEYKFLAFRKLKERLQSELNIDFSLPEIDRGLRAFSFNFKENRSLYDNQISAKLRQQIGFSKNVKIEYDAEAGAWQLRDNTPGGKTYTARKENNRLNIYKEYDGSQPVLKGNIRWFPLTKDGRTEKVAIEVTYIKLSLDVDHLENYPATVSWYYKKKRNWFKELVNFQTMPFPHEETSDISYGQDQFSAYRDLAYHIVRTYYQSPSAEAKPATPPCPEQPAPVSTVSSINRQTP